MTAAPTPVHHIPRLLRRPLTSIAALILLGIVALLLVKLDVFQKGSRSTPRPELQRILDVAVTGRNRIAPGATAYVSGPKGTWLGSAGLANVQTREPMPSDARMRLESVSKLYTATLILRLAQDRKLRLGDTVEHWLPGLLPYGNKITVGQLLSMTSGLIDNNDLKNNFPFYLARVKDTTLRARLLALIKRANTDPALEASPIWWVRLAAWQPLLSTPGTTFHYSNIGYELLGLIATRAGGKPFPTLYREWIFKPLGLEHTTYDPQGPIAGPHSHGYALGNNGKLTDATSWHVAIGAEGGIVSNAEETAAFLTGLMQGKLLNAAQLTAITDDNLLQNGGDSGCAGPAWGWSGGGNGYKTNVWVNRDGSRVTVLLLNARVNGDGGDTSANTTMQALYCAS
jgi:D-alanyl-D-alanine carboxypeptidase